MEMAFAGLLEYLDSYKWTSRGVFNNVTILYRNSNRFEDYFSMISSSADDENNEIHYNEKGHIQDNDFRGNGKFDMHVGGVYFCLTIVGDTGLPPETSPYGKFRISVPIEKVLGADDGNLYLLNWYLIRDKLYVILVWITLRENVDLSYLQHLVELDIRKNEFFKVEDGIWSARRGIWLELLVVGNVSVMLTKDKFTKIPEDKVTGKNKITK